MSDLAELIAKLESASEGSAELDRMIAVHPDTPSCGIVKGADIETVALAEEGLVVVTPPYTRSLDAALSLVPEDPRAEITGRWDWQVECTNGGMTISARVGPEETLSFADTPALALCIAALKARSAA